MKKNKTLIIVLIVFLIILIIVAGGLFIYLQTDFLKTNEQLFFKYVGENAKSLETYNNVSLGNYFKKLETTPYESSGKLTVNLDAPAELKDMLNVDSVNNLSLTFSGKTDKSKNASEQHIQLNYSDDVSFPVDLKKVNDVYGIASNIVINQYLAVDMSRIQELLTKLEVPEETSNEILNLLNEEEQTLITEEQMQAELEIYKNIILENLKDTDFTKNEDAGTFSLTISERQAFTILKQIITEASQSENLPSEVNELMESLLEGSDDVDASELPADNEFIKINVNKNGLIEIVIENSTNIQIMINNALLTITIAEDGETIISATITKAEDTNQGKIGYDFDLAVPIDDSEFNVKFSANYSNLGTQNVKENYVLAFEIKIDENDSLNYEYTLENTKTFVNSVNIEDFDSTSTVTLNDQEASYINQLAMVLPIQIQKVNSQLLQKIGLTDEQNPLINATPVTALIGYYINMQNSLNFQNDALMDQSDFMTSGQNDNNSSFNESYSGINDNSFYGL